MMDQPLCQSPTKKVTLPFASKIVTEHIAKPVCQTLPHVSSFSIFQYFSYRNRLFYSSILILPSYQDCFFIIYPNKVINNIHKLYLAQNTMAYYKQNMLSIKSRTLLANLLGEVVLLSQAIQTYRQALANIAHFDCIALFRFLDRDEKGYLRQKDFQRVMGTSHRKLLSYAFSWFDNMKVGEVSRLEFAAFLLPKDNLELREVVAQRVQNPQISNSQHETILEQFQIFSKLLMQIMNREMRIIQLRRELTKISDYTIRGVLLTIDGHGHEWVCSEDLFKFMKNYQLDVSLRQVEKLVEVINSTLNGKITQEQLRWTVEGFQTKNKTYLAKIKKSNRKEHTKKQKASEQLHRIQETGNAEKRDRDNKIRQEEDPLRRQYRLLMQKFKLAEEQEQKIDQQLKHYEAQFEESNQILCQQQIADSKERKKIEQQKQQQLLRARQREEATIRQLQNIDVNTFMLRARKLQQESQTLKQIERKLHIPPLDHPVIYATNQQYLQFKPQELLTGYSNQKSNYLEANTYKKDYTNLTDLNCLSEVQSHRKPSSRSEQISFKLTDGETYLQTAQDIKNRIKKQRQIERQIHQRFSSGQYYNSKYLPKTPETTNKGPSTPNVRVVNERGSVYRSPHQVNQFQSSSNKNTFSTANKQSAY